MNQPYPILEFDPNPEAIIEPSRTIRPKGVPECCVLCFFQDGEVWDHRDWVSRVSTREALFSLAAEACLALE
jgi:hypothetical protein